MTRWKPDARGRLLEAALALYREKGFDATTVAEIAERAGLTERTFFRYYTDKREVLFWGGHRLEAMMLDVLAKAPPSTGPMAAIGLAITTAAELAPWKHEASRERHAVIYAHAALHERELLKLASLGAALAKGLHARGVAEPDASLAAEAGIAVFRISFERWITAPKPKPILHYMQEGLATLTMVVAGTTKPKRATKAPR